MFENIWAFCTPHSTHWTILTKLCWHRNNYYFKIWRDDYPEIAKMILSNFSRQPNQFLCHAQESPLSSCNELFCSSAFSSWTVVCSSFIIFYMNKFDYQMKKMSSYSFISDWFIFATNPQMKILAPIDTLLGLLIYGEKVTIIIL